MVGRILADHHAVDQDAGDLDVLGVQGAVLGEALHLHDHHAPGVAHRRGDGQRLQGQGLALHADIAQGVGGGAAQQRHLQRQGPVEEVLLAVDGQQRNALLEGHVVDPAAAQARVDEGAQAHPGQGAGLAGGDVAEEMRDHPLRQVPGLDAPLDGELLQGGHQPPVAADHLRHQALVAQVVEPALLAVALAGGIHQGQVTGFSGLKEALLQGHGESLGEADADEAAGRQGVAVTDQVHGLAGGDHLALRGEGLAGEQGMGHGGRPDNGAL